MTVTPTIDLQRAAKEHLGFEGTLRHERGATRATPPADAGLVDLGPLVGLWYAAVSVQALRIWRDQTPRRQRRWRVALT